MTAPAIPQEALDVITAQHRALSLLHDLTWGEVCEPAERAAFFAKARAWSSAAMISADRLLWPVLPENHVSMIRRERREAEVAAQDRLPVKEHLTAERDAIRARVVAGLDVIDGWQGPTTDLRRQQAKTLLALFARLVDLTAQAAEPLPTTTLCCCPKCNRIALPSWHGSYQCPPCSLWWGPDPRAGHTALPRTFWEKKLPGDPGPRRDLEKTA